MGDVDSQSIDASVEPESEDLIELGDHFGVLPVHVRLADVEQMQVPIAVADRLPRWPAKD